MTAKAIYPDLNDRSVLITGGGTGIGAALTEGFVRQGAKVAFFDIAEKESHALAARLETDAAYKPLFFRVDLTDPGEIRKGVAAVEAANGPVRVLVNNAARDDRHEIEEVTPDYWDENQATNLRHHFFVTQAVLPGMKAAGGGSIVHFTSTAFMLHIGELASYNAAKAGVIGLMKTFAGKLGPYGIRANAIAPGWVMTERQKRLWVTEESLAAMLDKQCLKATIEPADMVGPCLFLASEAARMVTGQVLLADGGML
jgi:NAD(P)-dependent dehydrogenase (short-subunit alcohol dehydrogenase family)